MAKGKHSRARKEPRFCGFRQEKAFREQLAREYSVEKVPEHFQQMMEKTYRQLPDELPVRHRPVLRAFRSMATAAATLALTFAALLGVNTTYPQLTEALPGLGPVFQAVNGGRQVAPQPTPQPGLPTPEPTPQPVFQPVTLAPEKETLDVLGDLTVSDAWCDGKNLCMELRLSMNSEVKDMLDKDLESYTLRSLYYWSDDDGVNHLENTSVWRVSAGTNNITAMGVGEDADALVFAPAEASGFTAQWRIPLSKLDTDGEAKIRVDISIPDLAVVGDYDVEYVPAYWSPGYEGEFEVSLDTAGQRMISAPAMDNGATLQAVEYAPSQVDITMTLPYIGRYGDLLVNLDRDPESYLGLYATLESENGEVKYHQIRGLDEQTDRGAEPTGGIAVQYRFISDNPQKAVPGILRLTVHETGPVEGLGESGRVVAEFTIDLNAGMIYASQNYLAKGREKVGTATPWERFQYESLMEGGYLSCYQFVELDGYEDEFGRNNQCTMFYLVREGDPEVNAGWPLVIRAYHEEAIAQEFTIVTGDEVEDDTTFSYWEQPDYLPSTGKTYTLMCFTLNYQEWNYNEQGELMQYDRLELVDGETGLSLIEDIEASYKRNVQTILGLSMVGSPLETEADSQSSPNVEGNDGGAAARSAEPW